MAEVHSIWNQEAWNGSYASEQSRYEEIFLERRADNQRGHKPRRPVFYPAVESVAPAAPASKPRNPQPRTAQTPLERRLSLEETARRLTGKRQRK